MGGACSTMGRGEVYTGFWWGSLRGKRPLGRSGRRWEDNIKMDLQEVGRGGVYRVLVGKPEGKETTWKF